MSFERFWHLIFIILISINPDFGTGFSTYMHCWLTAYKLCSNTYLLTLRWFCWIYGIHFKINNRYSHTPNMQILLKRKCHISLWIWTYKNVYISTWYINETDTKNHNECKFASAMFIHTSRLIPIKHHFNPRISCQAFSIQTQWRSYIDGL